MLPGIPIHMTALPGTSNVFMASWLKSGAGTQAWVYDSATGIITDCTLKTFPYDFMCGGAILDDAGNLRVYGGRVNAERTARFNAAKLTWSEGPKLSVSAYYPTTIRTGQSASYPRGAILTATGRRKTIDIYDPHDYSIKIMKKMPASADIAEWDISNSIPDCICYRTVRSRCSDPSDP